MNDKPQIEATAISDGAIIQIKRGRKTERVLRLGPNQVHAIITHPDGTTTDLGVSTNLLTNSGRDLWANSFGHAANATGVNTSITATSLTGTAIAPSTDSYKGWTVFCPITGVTTAPVYGNIGTNSTTVFTVDQWWTAADGVGTTPATGNAFYVIPTCIPRFMGLTTDAAAASATDTVLATEILPAAANGCARALATFAHTGGTATYTQQKAYSVTGSLTAIHKMGLFTASTNTAGGIMVFETVLNADATVASGDTLTVTDTITLSG